jgi:hypothetical protein
VAVDFVVLVFPDRAAAFAAVLGDGDGTVLVLHGAVGTLHELGVAFGAAPVLLHAGAGLAQLRFRACWFWGGVLGHGALYKVEEPQRQMPHGAGGDCRPAHASDFGRMAALYGCAH